MSQQVKVDNLEVFRQFRVTLLKFAQTASQSLSAADSEISGMHGWLSGEQPTFWQGQLRKRTEALNAARDTLRQKKMFKDPSGKNYSAVEEEKAVAKCQHAVEAAQQKIVAIKKALPKLEDEAQLYRGGVSRIADAITGEIPKAVALLDRLATRIEEYLALQGPASGTSDGPSPFDTSITREMANEPPPPPVEIPGDPVATTENPEKTEEKNVTDGE